jgi:hypothetical protein
MFLIHGRKAFDGAQDGLIGVRKRVDKRGLPNATGADNGNEFSHAWNYKIVQQFGLPSKSCWTISQSSTVTEGRRVEEFYIGDEPVSILLFDREGLRQQRSASAIHQLTI